MERNTSPALQRIARSAIEYDDTREGFALEHHVVLAASSALAVAAFSPIAYVLVLYAMQQAPLSHVAPAREVSMLFAALIGGQLLGEGERGLRILGAVCIAGGVAALGLG